MTISDNEAKFFGLGIRDYESADDWQGTKVAYRVRTSWESKTDLTELLKQIAEHDDAGKLTAIVIGLWSGDDSGMPSDGVIQALVDLRDRFSGLRAIFLGDVAYTENEISWIVQSNVSPLLKAYPALEVLRVRGGNSLEFAQTTHASLRQLIVETGGLPRSVLREIFRCEFPKLEHLELWLGSANYGWDGGPEDLQPLLTGKLFSHLKYLGLRNSEMIDEIVPVVVNAPLLTRLEVLDLSLGNMSDSGANALLSWGKECKLSRLDVSHHYLSKGMVKGLKAALPCELVADDAQDADGEWRSIYVAE